MRPLSEPHFFVEGCKVLGVGNGVGEANNQLMNIQQLQI